jgi:uncharacterized iron-regulated membrane protein
VSGRNHSALWQQWLERPQKTWLRRALFQMHLWSGLLLGLYILVISITGSMVEYRNELYMATTPDPILSKGSGPRLSDQQVQGAAMRLYPGYHVVRLGRARNPDQAVDVWLSRGAEMKKRLFDPRTGSDLGDSVPVGIWLVSRLADLHENLLAGPTGRKLNGVGGIATVAVALTGFVIWWPGLKTWRRSLTLHRGVGWKRWMWHLHSAVGFWTFAFIVLFAVSGVYLSIPQPFVDLVDKLEPQTTSTTGLRFGDQVIYWLAYLHFGRINGIGIPCSGPGICDQTVKAVWALLGLAPAAMFITGAIMWWNRVLVPRLARARRSGRHIGEERWTEATPL